jgi:uncharacterized membrane protein YhhN
MLRPVSGVSPVWLLPAVLAAVDWYAVWRRDRRTQLWAKPAVLVGLIVTALALGASNDAAGIWLLVALVFGLCGDVFLLGEDDRSFRLGLGSFLVGHLAYVGCFIALGLDPQSWNYLSFLVLAGCLLATRQVAMATYLRGGLALAAPVAVYTVVIGAMVIYAFTTGVGLIAWGAAIFAVSDTVLARDRFVHPWDRAQLLVMVTYHVGQALIIAGVLSQ